MSKSQKSSASSIKSIISYTYPRLYTGECWYVGFYAFDPVMEKMRRKRIKINRISKPAERRRYANQLMKRLSQKLDEGWNPWIEESNVKAFTTFTEVCSTYRRNLDKALSEDLYRYDTYVSYISYLRNVIKYNEQRKYSISYIYQFDRTFIIDFLDHIYLDRGNSARTRDNYLFFLRTFSSFLVQHGYLQVKPTDGLTSLKKCLKKKTRTVIADDDLVKLHDYLSETNRYYLLACYILHYCFIRPKEMSMIRLKDIHLHEQTLFISDTVSKNRRDGTVTLPKKVIELMIELEIFNSHTAGDDYLFSDGFKPGSKYRSEKQFRDYWTHYVRKTLKFPDTYKFYSLKDTGITAMLRKYDPLTVRDQARHADILMTDTYTPHDIQQANKLIMNHDGLF